MVAQAAHRWVKEQRQRGLIWSGEEGKELGQRVWEEVEIELEVWPQVEGQEQRAWRWSGWPWCPWVVKASGCTKYLVEKRVVQARECL